MVKYPQNNMNKLTFKDLQHAGIANKTVAPNYQVDNYATSILSAHKSLLPISNKISKSLNQNQISMRFQHEPKIV